MIDFLSNPYIDRWSFWIGFLAGGLFWWFWGRVRPALPQAWQALKGRVETAREGIKAGTEARFRRDVLRYAQKQHLAASLFSLDEVAVQPYLLLSPPLVEPGKEDSPLDIFTQTIPFLPDWPEFSAAFSQPRLTLRQTLEGGANLVLLGNPGSGKTFALAHLASQIARRDAQSGSLASFVPILVHAADFILPATGPDTPLQSLIEAASTNASPLTLPRLPVLIKTVCEQGRAMLLLDGLDELGQEMVQQMGRFLSELLRAYPSIRVIAASAPEYSDGLVGLGLFPVAMAGWNGADRAAFVHQWSSLWSRFIDQDKSGTTRADPILVEGWLSGQHHDFSPLEMTLKTWAAFAGDALGSTASSAVEAYLLRLTTGIPKARPVLEKVAAESVRSMSGLVNTKEVEKAAQEEGAPLDSPDPEVELPAPDVQAGESRDSSDETASPDGKPSEKPVPERVEQRVLNELISCGIFMITRSGYLRFVHPVLIGYLAAASLSSSGDFSSIAAQPHWPGKTLTLRFAAGCTDLSEVFLPWLERKDDPLYRDLFTVTRGLREAPKNVRWRTAAMRRVANLLQQETLSLGVRSRIVAALALSGDTGVPVLFRQMLTASKASIRKLAALGCGIIRDPKALNGVLSLLEDPDSEVNKAALLAAAAYGTKTSLDAIAGVLLHSSEELRRAAAEVFAMDPVEGYSVLKDGCTVDDLLVRRAVVYGLAWVGESWAIQLMEKLQIEDGEWAVRSAATEALELSRQAHPAIPRPLPPLMNLPWLIAFAGKQGVGIPDESQAVEMLHLAVKSGNEEEQAAAVQVLGLRGNESSAAVIYDALYGTDGDLREAAFNAVWLLGNSGLQLPAPTQFGSG